MKMNYVKIHTVKGDMGKKEINIALTAAWNDESEATSKRLAAFSGESERFAVTFERCEDQMSLLPSEPQETTIQAHLKSSHSVTCEICGEILKLEGEWGTGHDLGMRVFSVDHSHPDMAQDWLDSQNRLAAGVFSEGDGELQAAIGDFVVIDVIAYLDGEGVIVNEKDWGLTLQEDEEQLPGYIEQFVGMRANGVKLFDLVIPEESTWGHPGNVVHFDVKVKEVLPAENAEPDTEAEPAPADPEPTTIEDPAMMPETTGDVWAEPAVTDDASLETPPIDDDANITLVRLTPESRATLSEISLSGYLGQRCKFCGKLYGSLSDLADVIYVGKHEHGTLACRECWNAKLAEEIVASAPEDPDMTPETTDHE